MSSSGSVFLCSVVLSIIHWSGSESAGAVLKLSDQVVSGVLHNSSLLNVSKLDNTGVLLSGSGTVLLVRGPKRSSSGDYSDGLSSSVNPKKPFLLGGILFLGYLAS